MNDTTAMNDTTPVVRTIDVSVPVDEAFRVFTEGMGTWWPLEVHSLYLERAEAVTFDAVVGGRVTERSADGEAANWAEVLVYEPPTRFVLAWKPNTTPAPPTRLEVTFTPAAGGTHVELTHSGWELLGDEWKEARSSYSEGWIPTLERYARAAETP